MRFSHQNEQRSSAEFSKINRYTKKSHVSTGTTGQIIERLVEMKGGGGLMQYIFQKFLNIYTNITRIGQVFG